MPKRMKKLIMTLLIASLVIALSGCTGNVALVTVVIQNSSEYKLEQIVLQIPQTRGSYSPMHNLLEAEDEALMPGEVREFTTFLHEQDFGNSGWAIIYVAGERIDCSGAVSIRGHQDNVFVITSDDGVGFAIGRGQQKE